MVQKPYFWVVLSISGLAIVLPILITALSAPEYYLTLAKVLVSTIALGYTIFLLIKRKPSQSTQFWIAVSLAGVIALSLIIYILIR